MKTSRYAILAPDYSIVAVSERIVELHSSQSLQPVETGSLVIATIDKLAPGLDFIFVSWKNRSNPKELYRGICSVAPRKGATDNDFTVGQRLLLQVTQPSTFGKLRVLSNQICFITSRMVAWPGHNSNYLAPSRIVKGAPQARGFTRVIPRPSITQTGPTRLSRHQYQIETDWEITTLDFVQVKTNSSNETKNIKMSTPVWTSWFSRPMAPSIVVQDHITRETVAESMIRDHPNVPRNFDVGNQHAWATWYSLHSAALRQPKIPLSCGGTLIIESTQSGWCIDVNSGTSLELGSKGRANQEAMYALIHQASIRSMHGSIMIDFIQDPTFTCLERILHTFCYLIQHDPYHTRIVYISRDGFMRILRNRVR